jgi:hypothetical protein
VRWEEGEKMNEKKWKRRYEKCWMIATDEEDLTGLFFCYYKEYKKLFKLYEQNNIELKRKF